MIPLGHNMKLFTNGITNLGHISGYEHKKICPILLGVIVDLPVPGRMDSTHIIRAVRTLMDF